MSNLEKLIAFARDLNRAEDLLAANQQYAAEQKLLLEANRKLIEKLERTEAQLKAALAANLDLESKLVSLPTTESAAEAARRIAGTRELLRNLANSLTPDKYIHIKIADTPTQFAGDC
jgi:hypothetical protein